MMDDYELCALDLGHIVDVPGAHSPNSITTDFFSVMDELITDQLCQEPRSATPTRDNEKERSSTPVKTSPSQPVRTVVAKRRRAETPVQLADDSDYVSATT